jgi:phosphatidyl-myo-inositol alpha-mannosyltransferase
VRIALVHPVYWPEVHRGTERIVHDIGARMAARGHRVVLLTSHPGPHSETEEDGIRVIRCRRPPRPPGMGLYELFLETLPEVAWRLARGRCDVAHAFHLASALATGAARRLGGPPFAYSFHGYATRTYIVARRRRLEMLNWTLAAAGAVTVLSEAAAQVFARHLPARPEVLPAGVSLESFSPRADRYRQPTLLCAASFTDPRKRIPLLLDAFSELRRGRSEARLLVADNPDPSISGARPRLPDGAEWVDMNAPGALADAYGRSWATVLPSVDEAQGMVLLESLAAGTPIVAAASGAPPGIHAGRDEIGRIFAPNDRQALVRALEAALDLAQKPSTAAACRARAEDYSWQRSAPAHEELYARVAGGRR